MEAQDNAVPAGEEQDIVDEAVLRQRAEAVMSRYGKKCNEALANVSRSVHQRFPEGGEAAEEAIQATIFDPQWLSSFWREFKTMQQDQAVRGAKGEFPVTPAEARDDEAMWRYALKWLPVMASQLNTERIGSVMTHHVHKNSGAEKTEVRTALGLNKRHVEDMVALRGSNKRQK